MNLKSKIIVLFLALSCSKANAQFVQKHGQLSVKGTKLVDKNQIPVVLRGVSFGWHSFHHRFYNEDAVQWIAKDFNATVVRAAMGVEHGDLCYIKQPEFSKQKIEAIVEGAIKSDIYVIVDWHSHNINTKEAKVFFAEISKKYGKFPNMIYEVYNEPDYETWTEVKKYAEEIIKVIRANDPDNVILIGSPHWDQDVNLPADQPIRNCTNLMYTMHFYAGTHGKELRDRTDEAIKKGLPIFVSESAGMEATGDGALNYNAWQVYVDWMEERKISWITWSVSDKDETCSMLNTTAHSEGNWNDAELKESGLKTRALLKKYNKDN